MHRKSDSNHAKYDIKYLQYFLISLLEKRAPKLPKKSMWLNDDGVISPLVPQWMYVG